MKEKKKLLAVTGPTATGKTALGIALAKQLNGEIVSCDSMQVYQGLRVGTAQPSNEELAQAPHHLVGFLPWEKAFSVSDYVDMAGKVSSTAYFSPCISSFLALTGARGVPAPPYLASSLDSTGT